MTCAHSQTTALQSFCVVIFSGEMTSENLFSFFSCQYPHVHQADRGSCVTVASIAYQTTSRSHRYNVSLQHTATHCNTLQLTVASIAYQTTSRSHRYNVSLQHTATHCNTLQLTVASIAYQTTSRSHRYNVSLQHTATHCNTLQLTVASVAYQTTSRSHRYNVSLQHTATRDTNKWVLKRREFYGFARVNKVTSASLRYPLSVFNKNSTLKRDVMSSIE